MQPFVRKMWGETGWGMPTSVGLHLMLALLLLVQLPELSPPAKEQSISVELVPPPRPREKPPEKQDAPKPQQARPQPRAFESASARGDKERPRRPQLPPAAPRLTDIPRPAPEQPRTPAERQSEAGENKIETKNALAELRVESEESVDGAENAEVPRSAPAPQQKPVRDEAKADDAQTPEEAGSQRLGPALVEAKEIYSKDALSDPRVKQAIGRLPPKKRIVQLCSIEALEQVRRQRPNAFPDMLVPFGPSGGSISAAGMSASGGAFRSRAKWYAVDFRCEVDAESTSIVSFSYAIGKAIPKSEWAARQLPEE